MNKNRALYLGLIANKILPKKEYLKLTAKFTKGHRGTTPLYNIDKMYEVLSKDERLKPYNDKYKDVEELVNQGKFDDALKLINVN